MQIRAQKPPPRPRRMLSASNDEGLQGRDSVEAGGVECAMEAGGVECAPASSCAPIHTPSSSPTTITPPTSGLPRRRPRRRRPRGRSTDGRVLSSASQTTRRRGDPGSLVTLTSQPDRLRENWNYQIKNINFTAKE